MKRYLKILQDTSYYEVLRMKLKIYSDGACRGNPCRSAIAYVILDYEEAEVLIMYKCGN